MSEEISAFAANLMRRSNSKKRKKRKRVKDDERNLKSPVEKKMKEHNKDDSANDEDALSKFEKNVSNRDSNELNLNYEVCAVKKRVKSKNNGKNMKRKQSKDAKIKHLDNPTMTELKKEIALNSNNKKPKKVKVKKSSPNNDLIASLSISQNGKLREVSEEVLFNSIKVGKELLTWLTQPFKVKEFFKNFWEKKPLHIVRKNKNYYSNVCTLADFKEIFQNHNIYFTKNIDVTSYKNGIRVTENPVGIARPAIIEDLFKKGKSIRLLNPQTFLQNVRMLTVLLQDFFRCFVGANMYYTPPNSQGFAPHFDDIEAFVLQLVGKKEWKLYYPRITEEVLPRVSSRNFRDEDLGQPFLEVILEPGDLLYFPRGIIHQACCLEESSLHITISCYQRNSWADLLEKALPAALQIAVEEDVEFRKGLPINYLDHLGLIHSDSRSKKRKLIFRVVNRLMSKLINYCPLDACADQLGKNFMHDALPPHLTAYDLKHGAEEFVLNKPLMEILTSYYNKKLGVKLIRAYACRLVKEEDALRVYYNTHNSREYHGEDAMFVEIPVNWAAMVEHLLKSYPKYVDMNDLKVPLGDGDGDDMDEDGGGSEADYEARQWSEVVKFIYELWGKGLILFSKPLRSLKKKALRMPE